MKIFLSYASEDRPQAEEIQLALAGAGHEVFFDRQSLPAGGDYHARIKASVDDAELFVFLISPDAVDPGGYTLTEMGYARSRWPHPKGHVLPVVLRPTDFKTIPAYLKSVTVLEPSGNAAAEVVAAVERLADGPSKAGLRKYALMGAAGVAVLAGVLYMAIPRPDAPAAPGTPIADDAKRPAHASGPELPNPVQLRFSYKPVADAKVALDDTLRVNLQTKRRIVDGERLAQQPGGFYSYNTAYPAADDRILGTLIREIRESSLGAPPGPARFCLKRPAALEPSNDQHVHLDCDESNSCKLHFPSPKWLEPCTVEEIKTSRGFSLLPLAHAADTVRRWSVPSAKTLAVYKDQMKGVGYTLVQIDTDVLRDPAIIGVEVDVRVNGVPVLEDGLAPALRPVPNDPGKTFRHSFALQSLDFEGAQAGCEAIVLTLRPRLSSGKTGEPLSAMLPYVALRDAPGMPLPFGKGTLNWSAKYMVPDAEWSHEAFITSVTYARSGGEAAAVRARDQAVALKQDFDKLGLTHNGRPLVAVIRPPLTLAGDTLAYGLTTGVVQVSGQVRFTFSPQDAHALGDRLLQARSDNAGARRVIDREKYIYKVAGTRERQETPTPSGVCSHVKAP
jgi:hypothetical protein